MSGSNKGNTVLKQRVCEILKKDEIRIYNTQNKI